jgi:hypothetical protein
MCNNFGWEESACCFLADREKFMVFGAWIDRDLNENLPENYL